VTSEVEYKFEPIDPSSMKDLNFKKSPIFQFFIII